MEYRNLGRTGVKVSPLCLGTMMFGWKTEEKDSMDIVDRAIEGGINFIDTANVYSRGTSEEYVGKALQRNGKRNEIVLATKVHGGMNDDDPNAWGNSRRHIVEQCEASLKRLQTDYIDLYQIHRPQSDIPIDETLRALDDLISAGKVRYVGTSTFAAWQVVESIYIAKELGLNRFVSEQPPYHLLDRRVERELLPVAKQYGLAILPWSPLAGGFLTGKYKRKSTGDAGRLSEDNEWNRNHFIDPAFTIAETIVKMASAKGCATSQLALAWCAQQDGVTSPIIGPRTIPQLEDNLGAIDLTLTQEDLDKIDEVAEPGRATVPYYDADFSANTYR
ncbi:MAG: aldo/keto reductase [Candidatus Marinimicrobia bacterium]|nr:aldo/keto reductase [Candidatus Neomarinimicrobiota bacterium]MCF7880149.1 aldo/keto reductase [Candidatus Neomarinimicrobiota bacterium]